MLRFEVCKFNLSSERSCFYKASLMDTIKKISYMHKLLSLVTVIPSTQEVELEHACLRILFNVFKGNILLCDDEDALDF